MENIFSSTKQEYTGEASSSSSSSRLPRPREGLHDMGPPAFLIKTFEMVSDFCTDEIVSWGREGQSFVVWDIHAFSASLLPNSFKHNNFSSFVRQLNTYGFRKINSGKWEFANEFFLRGQKQLLKYIKRKKQTIPTPSETPQSAGTYGSRAVIDGLLRDKQAMSMEIATIRQNQQESRVYVHDMELRLRRLERRQHQMMGFFAKVIQNPDFIQQLISRRRREIGMKEPIKVEPLDFGGDELEALAMEMQGFGKKRGCHEMANDENDLDDEFWEKLLNEEFDKMDCEDEDGVGIDIDDVDLLVGKFGVFFES